MQERHLNDRVGSLISMEEVKAALRRTKSGNIVGLDLMLVKIWKCIAEVGLDWLTELFHVIFRTAKRPTEWRTSTVIPLH